MPDNDKWLKIRGSHWKKPYNSAIGCGDARDVAELLAEGMSKFLSSCGGVPDFERVAQTLRPFFGAQRDLFAGNAWESEAACERLAQARCGEGLPSQLAEIQCRTARGILLQAQMEGAMPGNAENELARRLLPEIACAQFVDRLDTSKPFVERFEAASGGDALLAAQRMDDYRNEIRQHLPAALERLALAVASNTSINKLPSCRRRMPKRSLAEWNQFNISL